MHETLKTKEIEIDVICVYLHIHDAANLKSLNSGEPFEPTLKCKMPNNHIGHVHERHYLLNITFDEMHLTKYDTYMLKKMLNYRKSNFLFQLS